MKRIPSLKQIAESNKSLRKQARKVKSKLDALDKRDMLQRELLDLSCKLIDKVGIKTSH